MTENKMATSADNAGVVARPPLLSGGTFVVVLVVRWFWPMPIFGHALALWPGVAAEGDPRPVAFDSSHPARIVTVLLSRFERAFVARAGTERGRAWT